MDAGTRASVLYAMERTGQFQRFTTVRADASVHFVVCRMTFALGDDKIDLWIDPAPGSTGPSEESIAASATVRDFHFNRVRFCSAPVPMNFDALRLGTKFSDLVPRSSPEATSTLPTLSWARLLAIATIMVLLGILILGTLFWAFARRRRGEPPLVGGNS
jgi:hypothetical protein